MPEIGNRVQYCSYLLILIGVVSCLFGITYIFSSQPMPYHLSFIGMSFEDIRNLNPNLAAFLASIVKSVGACELALGILAVGIALGPFRRTERWAWITVLPAVSIVLADLLRASFFIGAPVRWLILALAILFLTAMLVPVKDFFGSR